MELSIIVPIYNVEDYLEECLKSLYNIKNIKLEIILVNDGSKDNSFKIMEKFKEIGIIPTPISVRQKFEEWSFM